MAGQHTDVQQGVQAPLCARVLCLPGTALCLTACRSKVAYLQWLNVPAQHRSPGVLRSRCDPLRKLFSGGVGEK